MGEIGKSAPWEGSAILPNLPPVIKRRKPLQIRSPSPSGNSETIRLERTQLSHGRIIQVVSVFPRQGRQTPEDKLKALVDLEFQQGKLCA